MAIEVIIIGENKDSDEYLAALKLRDIIKRDLINVKGRILLYVSATILGQEVKDIDLIMMGELSGYSPKLFFYDSEGNKIQRDVDILNFFVTIEIKSHSIEGVYRRGTDFYVKYGANTHCVTSQSNKQKYSLMIFFKNTVNFSPYICSLIWFIQISKEDIHELLIMENNDIISNVFGNEVGFNEIIQLLLWQNIPTLKREKYIFNSNFQNIGMDNFQKALNLFEEKKTSIGILTRKRIEELAQKQFLNLRDYKDDNSLQVIRGKAGSGKTVSLIVQALELIDKQDARVLMLTYNNALVSDLKRLFAFAELPDMFEERCLNVNTIQSFFFLIINDIIFNKNLNGEFYLEHYEKILNEFIEYIAIGQNLEFVKEYMSTEFSLDWNYILIDEAQDWSKSEKIIILKLYNLNQIIVADGGNQFVRNIDVCDWTDIKSKRNIKLKYCLRQKANLVSFINHFSTKIGSNINKTNSFGNMFGGKVIIDKNGSNLFQLHQREYQLLISNGNIGYDMMYLAPSNMVLKTKEVNCFKYLEELKKNGINLWDGTSKFKRNSFSINTEEVRLFQYDSCRGLEAWSVICINFDEFIEEKLSFFSENTEIDRLYLESIEDKRKRYILNWALMPLTRAIDTIIITLSDENSYISKILLDLADEYSDYIMLAK